MSKIEKPSAPKIVKIGDKDYTVLEPEYLLPIYADVVTEARVTGSIVRLSLGCFVIDGSSDRELRIVARLCLPIDTIKHISNAVISHLAIASVGDDPNKPAN